MSLKVKERFSTDGLQLPTRSFLTRLLCFAGTVDELQDTAILSTVDADLSHIPSLHNTLENDPYMQRETSDSLDNDPNIEWLEPLPDLLRTPSQLAGDTLTSPDETEDLEKGTWPCHGGNDVTNLPGLRKTLRTSFLIMC